jgi:hypothetical protein
VITEQKLHFALAAALVSPARKVRLLEHLERKTTPG